LTRFPVRPEDGAAAPFREAVASTSNRNVLLTSRSRTRCGHWNENPHTDRGQPQPTIVACIGAFSLD